MSARQDLSGMKYGSLLVKEYSHTKNTHAMWKCKCLRCNNDIIVSASNLKSGNTNSCISCCKIKLTKSEDDEVRKLYDSGKTIVSIAKQFNVSRSSIYTSLKRTEKN